MKRTPERDTQADILVFVTNLPHAFFVRANTGAGRNLSGRVVQFNIVGTPDIIGCYRGWFVGIEVKSAGGRQSIDQQRYQAALTAADGLYILARSVEDVYNGIQSLNDRARGR